MKFSVEWKGNLIDCTWVENTAFKNLQNIKQISAFIFDEEGKICLIQFPNKGYWSLPGGSPEKIDKDFEETLMREISEEADLEVKNFRRIGYIEGIPKDNPEKKFQQLRYIAKVDKIKEQTPDPANNIVPRRKFVDPKKVIELLKWDGTEIQVKAALKAFGLLNATN